MDPYSAEIQEIMNMELPSAFFSDSDHLTNFIHPISMETEEMEPWKYTKYHCNLDLELTNTVFVDPRTYEKTNSDKSSINIPLKEMSPSKNLINISKNRITSTPTKTIVLKNIYPSSDLAPIQNKIKTITPNNLTNHTTNIYTSDHATTETKIKPKYGKMGSNQNTDSTKVPEKAYPKPTYSYSCLIAMALKNSQSGKLPVNEIYTFMTDNFPYFKTAPNGWKNSVRHNLSLNKCFEKVEQSLQDGSQRKRCLWQMNPAKIDKLDEELCKCTNKDPMAIKRSMANPERLPLLEKGQMKHLYSKEETDEKDEPSDSEEEIVDEVKTEAPPVDSNISFDSSLDTDLSRGLWADDQLFFNDSSQSGAPEEEKVIVNSLYTYIQGYCTPQAASEARIFVNKMRKVEKCES